ncbi:MAG TPA: AraC family transcriptional regulator [Tepidisphaeraceae bacterium]|nr:AraC family transcriptional regulator [Tepidisphaeraceae bacterium]
MRARPPHPDAPGGLPVPAVRIVDRNVFPAGWHLPEHAHARVNELVFVTAGRLATRIDGETVVAGPGTAVLHPAGVPHEEWAEGTGPLHTFYVSWLAETPPDEGRAPPPPGVAARWVSPDPHGHMEAALRWMDEMWANGASAATATLFAVAVDEFNREPPSAGGRMVAIVRQYVRENLDKPLDVRALAAVAGMSRAHFNRCFRRAAGQSPMAFVRGLRVTAARHLLTGPMTLDAIAVQVGLRDRSHLSRVYRRITGEPPCHHRG